ncbi:MAG: anthranilate phosphoribosyltransferase, partial [Acidimicrobiia bacterium]|nr:anthranilate phosphoribosyltransferase [Acidimicrobiia bacterium]
TGPSTVVTLTDGEVATHVVDPASLGLAPATRADLAVRDVEHAVRAARAVLGGERGPHRDIVCLNAAAGLVVAGLADDLSAGLERAADALDSGRAETALQRLVATSTA